VQLFKALEAEVARLIQRNIGFLEQEPDFASAEVLCRTEIESTINLYYCSPGDSVEIVPSYVKVVRRDRAFDLLALGVCSSIRSATVASRVRRAYGLLQQHL
jgi:hypothetical protein